MLTELRLLPPSPQDPCGAARPTGLTRQYSKSHAVSHFQGTGARAEDLHARSHRQRQQLPGKVAPRVPSPAGQGGALPGSPDHRASDSRAGLEPGLTSQATAPPRFVSSRVQHICFWIK